jgi:hypothetical protein
MHDMLTDFDRVMLKRCTGFSVMEERDVIGFTFLFVCVVNSCHSISSCLSLSLCLALSLHFDSAGCWLLLLLAVVVVGCCC